MKIKGIAKVVVRDKNTMDVLREKEYTNTFTMIGDHLLLSGVGFNNATLPEGTSTTGEFPSLYKYNRVMLSEAEQVPSIRSNSRISGNIIRGTEQATPTWFPASVGTPAYVEFVHRFLPPSTVDRNIYTIFMGEAATSVANLTAAYVSFSVPCIQTTSEILDVFYRIQFPESSVTNSIDSVNFDSLPDVLAESFSIKTTTSGWPRYEEFSYVTDLPDVTKMTAASYKTVGTNSIFPSNQIVYDVPQMKKTSVTDESITDRIGQLQGLCITGADTEFLMSSLVTPSGFINKPIQPIHNHSSQASSAFLDVDFLAGGSGALSIDGSSWNDPDFAKFYRFDISTTGNAGVATYSYKKRPVVGFTGDNYDSARPTIPWINSGVDTTTNAYGFRDNTSRFAEYDGGNVVTWATGGITIFDLTKSDYTTFDGLSTPALPISSIADVIVDDTTGDIWVACNSSGLYRISNALTSPVITKMTIATNGVPSDTLCYGVSIGYNNSIWAMFDGGLSRTDNNGTSWTTYNPTSGVSYSYVGITDNNWNNVRWIAADANSPDHKICVVYTDPTNITNSKAFTMWWDVTSGTSSLGPNTDYLLGSDGGVGLTKKVQCSRYGGLFISVDTNYNLYNANGDAYKLTYGSSTKSQIGGTSNTLAPLSNVVFVYDYYDRPYVYCSGGYIAPLNYSAIYDSEDFLISRELNTFVTAGQGANAPLFALRQSNIVVGVSQQATGTAEFDNNDRHLFYVSVPCPAANILTDPLNGKYTPFQEFAWTDFKWNGSAWQEKYFAPAVDSSLTATDATRHNFDIESHYFTGRACIDASTVTAPGNFTNTLTAAFTIEADPKINGQHPDTYLYHSLDLVNGTSIAIIWNGDTGNNQVGIDDGVSFKTFGTAPANDSSTRRAVFVINGSAATCYIDNVQFGSTLTLASVTDLSNPTSTLTTTLAGRNLNDINGPDRFFKGNLRNIQLWNVAWTLTDVANDFADITAVIASQPAANMIARYQLTETLSETKIVHLSSDALDDGLTITFSDGTGTSFNATDYYTTCAYDGIFKDNAISYTLENQMIFNPTSIVTDAEDTVNSPNVPAVIGTGGQITESAIFDRGFTRDSYILPGQIGGTLLQSGYSTVTSVGSYALQTILGDGSTSATLTHSITDTTFAWADIMSPTSRGRYNWANYKNAIRLMINGDIQIYESGASKGIVGTYVFGDVVTITRVGTTVTYLKNGLLLYTSLNASSGIMFPAVSAATTVASGPFNLHNITVTYTRPDYIIDMGNSVNLTGKYDVDYRTFNNQPAAHTVTINGVTATLTVDKTNDINSFADPGPGNVIIIPDAGLIVCSASDVGKSIAISSQVITNK